MSEAPAVSTLSPWFGSKRTLAPRIAAELGPKPRLFLDAFCGGLSVLMAKEPCGMEMACDRHGDLANLARVIQHPTLGAKFYRRARRLICSQEQFEDVKTACRERDRQPAPKEPDLDHALQFFLFSWLGKNGVAGSNGGVNFCVRYTANGGCPAVRLASAVDSIPAFRRRLRDVIVLNEDSFEVIDRVDDQVTTAIYCDPPYVVKGANYLHDFTPDDHARLAALLRKKKHTRVVVSYYDHPMVRKLYDGWTFVDCTMTKAMAKAGQRGGGENVKAHELLIINGPSYTAAAEGLFA